MKGFTVEKDGATLVVTQKKRPWIAVFLLFFGFSWLGISSVALANTGSWFLALFVLIGVLVLYGGLVQLFNRRRVQAGPRQLVSRSGPIPVPGQLDIDIRQIDQLFAMENSTETVNNKTTVLYALKAKLMDGSTPVILQNIRSREEALELEALLENHLGIKDRALENEDPPQLKKLKEMIPALKDAKLPGPINDGKPGETNIPTSDSRELAPKLIEGFAESDIYAARLGDKLHWKQQDWIISQHEQFDWNNNLSDVGMELTGGSGTSSFYAEGTGDEYLYFEERALSVEEAHQLEFIKADEPAAIVQNGEDKYYRRNEVSGFRHLNHANQANRITQWIYFRTTGSDRFRVVKTATEWKIYIQELVSADNLKVVVEEKVARKRK
ncbi:MAG: hypothetical protein AAF828_06965 [Bacteroidota bacterium]